MRKYVLKPNEKLKAAYKCKVLLLLEEHFIYNACQSLIQHPPREMGYFQILPVNLTLNENTDRLDFPISCFHFLSVDTLQISE